MRSHSSTLRARERPPRRFPIRCRVTWRNPRFDRLTALVRSLSLASNERAVGETAACLVEGPSRRDPGVLSARTPHNRLVHVPLPEGESAEGYAGSVAQILITGGHPWFLTGEFARHPV